MDAWAAVLAAVQPRCHQPVAPKLVVRRNDHRGVTQLQEVRVVHRRRLLRQLGCLCLVVLLLLLLATPLRGVVSGPCGPDIRQLTPSCRI